MRFRLNVAFLMLVAVCGQTARANWEYEENCCSLVGQYAIH
jgi:hypothetical protein